MKRNMRAMTYEEAMVMVEASPDRYVTARYMAKGWYVWATRKGEFYCHNPYHGKGPSMRDHGFVPSEEDRKSSWFEVTP